MTVEWGRQLEPRARQVHRGLEAALVVGLAAGSWLGCARSEPGHPSRPAATDATPAPRPRPDDSRLAERLRMVTTQLAARGIEDARVLEAMRRVPRHRFVLAAHRDEAYADSPLPIVGGQTISQPFIVARMTEAASPSPEARCLEIGTGSGYQAAVLAELCQATYSIEYLPEVAEFGRRNLQAAGYLDGRVFLRVGDGYAGWPEHAPFDVILVTAAPERVPQPLLDQLAPGGRLVIPVGGENETQRLELWTRSRSPADQPVSKRVLDRVRFVPFLGEHGKRESPGSDAKKP